MKVQVDEESSLSDPRTHSEFPSASYGTSERECRDGEDRAGRAVGCGCGELGAGRWEGEGRGRNDSS